MTKQTLWLVMAGAFVLAASAAALAYLLGAFAPIPGWLVVVPVIVSLWLEVEAFSWLVLRRKGWREASDLLFAAATDTRGRGLSPMSYHPFVNFVPTPSLTVDGVNDRGFRSSGPTEGFNGVRVYLAGDCTAYDGHLPAQHSLAYLLEEALRDLHPEGVEVVNAGSAHYTSLHSLNRFTIDAQRFDLDLAIFVAGINDVLSVVHTGGVLEPDYSGFYRAAAEAPRMGDTLPGRWVWLFKRLPSLRTYTYWTLRGLLPGTWNRRVITLNKAYTSKDNLERCYAQFHTRYFKANLRSFIALCRLHQVRPVLMTNYYNAEDMAAPVRAFYAYGIDLANDEIRRTGLEERVPVLDMARELADCPAVAENKWHFTPSGNRKRVRIIAEFLKRHELIASSPASVRIR